MIGDVSTLLEGADFVRPGAERRLHCRRCEVAVAQRSFIARFPVGLVIYWVTTNLWTVGQGLITRRLVPKTPLPAGPAGPKRSSRNPPKNDGAGDGAPPAAAKPGKPATPPPPRRVKRKKGGARR